MGLRSTRAPRIVVDLGTEPPLTAGSGSTAPTPRSVNARWFIGTVATAITSILLMGGALVTALEGRYVVEANASLPSALTMPAPGPAATKGDRFRPVQQKVSSRQIIQVGTVMRQGGAEHIRNRPYALVTVSLPTDPAAIDRDIPGFDPTTVAHAAPAQEASAATDAIWDQKVDGELTVTVRDFPAVPDSSLGDKGVMTDQEVEAQVRDQQWVKPDGTPVVPSAGSGMVVPEADGSDAIPSGPVLPPNVTIVPENVSELVKTETAPDATGGDQNDFVEIVQPGDTLSKILLGSGVDAVEIKAIDQVFRNQLRIDSIKPDEKLWIVFDVQGDGEDRQRSPVRVSIYDGTTHRGTVARTDAGSYVAAPAPAGPVPDVPQAEEAPDTGSTPLIYRSLLQTARDHDIPQSVVKLLVRQFSYDVNFNGRTRVGDQLQVLYSVPEKGAKSDGSPEVLFASLTAAGVEKRFYRFKSNDDAIDYYDADGRTAEKFLTRKPITHAVFTSGFGPRRHPILGITRMHTGVDWGAPYGTPIYAAGDGVIKEAGWKAGYGRWVMIGHMNGYDTGYGHMSRIADGIKDGVRVRQGEIIGYVGSTGLSTGPHLHYEIHVNGVPVDPMKIRLPHGHELDGQVLTAFENERDRIDKLIDNATGGGTAVAQN